jgi:radical SAM superfamily enzyme YgiQ (UPF0313 family)
MTSSAQLADGRLRTGKPKLRLINPRSPLTTITMPEIIQKMTFSRRALFMPLNLAICARLASDAGWDVEIVDENLTDGLHAARADVDAVGVGAMTTQARRAYEIGDAYLALDVPVILGGIHPSALPQEALAHATVVCKGDAEATLPYALNDLRSWDRRLACHPASPQSAERTAETAVPRRRIYDWADHPDSPIVTPRKDLLDPKQYLVFNPIQTTRGCPHGCTFCTTPAIFGRKFRQRAIPDIVAEMREAKERFNTSTFIFSDDDVAGNHAWAMELFEAIKPLKVRWASQCDILISRNDKLLAAMRASGCQGIILGLESPNAATLRQAGKRYVNADEYLDRIHKIHSHRISIWGSFIFGFDTDNWHNCMETVRFAQRAGLCMSCYPILTPYPGTAVYDQYLAQGRLLTQDWDKYNGATVVFQPQRMTVEELRYAQMAAFHEFYQPSSAMRRLKIWPLKRNSWLTNLAIYRGLTYYYNKKGRALPYFRDYMEPDACERISRGLGLTSRGRNGKFTTAAAK